MSLLLAASESGYFNFINIMWVIVGVVLTVSLLWTFVVYVGPWIIKLPGVVLEALAWATSGAFVYLPSVYVEGGGAVAIALVGCLGLSLCAAYTLMERFDMPIRVMVAVIGALLAGAALLHSSSVIGTLAVAAFVGLTGSLIVPLVEESPFFEKRQFVPSVFLTSGASLAVFVILRISGISSALDIFAPGVFWLCGLSYSASCMALASRHYGGEIDGGYVMGQIVAVVSGLGAIFIGAVYEIPVLQELGGTFMAIYIVEKFFDLPWSKDHWALVSLAFAGLLYAGVRFAELHPQYFLGF